MEISVIIPTLNEEAAIGQAVDRAWQISPREVIVVDGGSRDRTVELAQALPCTLLCSDPGRGIQQNLGARAAQGDVLLWLHCDCWLDSAAGREIARALADERVVGGAFRQHIEAPERIYRWLERGNDLRAGWLQRPYGDQGLFARRSVFERAGGFPPVRLMEDVLLAKSLRKAGRLALLSGPIHVSPRRWQRQGVARQTLQNWVLLAGLRLGVSPDRLARYYDGRR